MDAVTTVKMASEVANSQVVWSILCIAMTVYLLYSQKQEKKEWRDDRKETLEVQKSFSEALASQADTMKEISNALNETNKSMQNLEGRIDNIERNSYRGNNRNSNRDGR